MKKRAVGYCRISTLMQVDNTSLKDQEDKIKMYAQSKWTICIYI